MALDDEALPRAVIADPRAVAAQAADPVTRVLVQLARGVTEAPWTLTPSDLAAARTVGLSDEAILQAVLLSAFFGHLNRMADAVGIELDYDVVLTPPKAVPNTPPYRRPTVAEWRDAAVPRALVAALRPGIVDALSAWRAHALFREAPLDRRQRSLIGCAVAERLGDSAAVRELAVSRTSALDEALVAAAEVVTLAPWRLGAAPIAALRAAGLSDDAAIFDVFATAAACTTFSRSAVALAALGV